MNNFQIFAKTSVTALSGIALFIVAATANAGVGAPTAYQVSVPEPSVLTLMAGGFATAVLLARAKRKK